MTRRGLRSCSGLGSSLVVALALAGGCLNPRPEDFPSANFSGPGDQLGGSTGSPGNGTGSGGDNYFEDDGDPSYRPSEPANPSVPTGGDDDRDAGAPVGDGGAATALAAHADGGAAVSESTDGCEPDPGPR